MSINIHFEDSSSFKTEEYFVTHKYLMKLYNEEIECLQSNPLVNLIIVDLVIQLEKFAKQSTLEFISLLNKKSLSSKNINDAIKIESTRKIINELNNIINYPQKVDKISNQASKIFQIWNNEDKPKIDIDLVYNYGKHGSEQFKKLFQKIGINDIFEELALENREYVEETSLLNRDLDIAVHIKTEIDNVTKYRNYIIHQGSDFSSKYSQQELLKLSAMMENIFLGTSSVLNKKIRSNL